MHFHLLIFGWILVSLGCSMLARYSFPQHWPVNLWDVVWFSPSEQERMRAWKTSQADFAFCLELVLEWSFGESSGSGMKVTCCFRCFTDANAFGEPVQTHPKRSKSKIWGLLAIASHRESLATMISDSDAFPATLIWFHWFCKANMLNGLHALPDVKLRVCSRINPFEHIRYWQKVWHGFPNVKMSKARRV